MAIVSERIPAVATLWRSVDAELREFLCRAFRVIGHDQDQLLIAQILARHMLPIRGLIGPHRILRPQPGPAQESLQRIRRKRLLQVVDGLEIHTLRGQDPLDLAALGSRRFLVNGDLGGIHLFPFSVLSEGLAIVSDKFVDSLGSEHMADIK